MKAHRLVLAAIVGLMAAGIRAGEPDAKAEAPKADTKPADAKAEPKAEDPAQKLAMQIAYCLDLADVHIRYGVYDTAKTALQEVFKLGADPKANGVLRAHLVLGTVLQRQEKWPEAIKEYESIQPLLTQPNDQVTLAALVSQCYDKLKEPAKAEAALMALTSGKSPQAVRQEGWRRLVEFWRGHREQLDATVKGLDVALVKDAKDAETLERLAVIFTDITPDPKKAETYTEKLADLGPKDPDVCLRLAGLYERQKAWKKAMKVYQTLVPLVPKALSWEVDVRSAIMMVYAGKRDDAVERVEKELAPKAQTVPERVGLAQFYSSAGLPVKAEETYLRAATAAQTAEDVSACMLAAAESCRSRKNYDKAEEYMRAVLKQYRDNKPIRAQVNAALLKLYEEQGRLGDLNLQQ